MVKTVKYIVLLFISTFCIASNATAGGDEHDFATAYSIGISKKFNKRVGISLDESLVLKNSSTRIDKIYTTAGVSCTIVRRIFKVGLDYRAIGKNLQQGFVFNQRFSGYTNLKYEVNRFTFAWKSKYQMTYRPEKIDSKEWKNYWRNRLSVSMKVPKIALYPSLSAEMFYTTNKKSGNVIDCMRYEAALKYEFNKKNSLELYFDYDDEMNVAHPVNLCKLGLAYQISF